MCETRGARVLCESIVFLITNNAYFFIVQREKKMKCLLSWISVTVAQVPEAMVTNLNDMYYQGTQAYYDVSDNLSQTLFQPHSSTGQACWGRPNHWKVDGKLENASKYWIIVPVEMWSAKRSSDAFPRRGL